MLSGWWSKSKLTNTTWDGRVLGTDLFKWNDMESSILTGFNITHLNDLSKCRLSFNKSQALHVLEPSR